ncbi:MAG: transporter substrate-binding domain-containing protein [Alphaproteobacteria bacterium]|nr:transporter substrate-binding domain-containing protein [Alphaproteobacteria bacterium]
MVSRLVIIVMIFLGGAVAAPTRPAAQDFTSLGVVRLATGPDYPPFSAEELPDGGVITQLVRAAFERAGVTVTLETLPWRRGYEMTASGAIDATFPYAETATRLEQMLFSTPIFNVDVSLYYRRTAPILFRQPLDLAPFTLCAPIGYGLSPSIAELAQLDVLTVRETPSPLSCLRQAALGRVDAVVLPRLQVRFLMDRFPNDLQGLTEAPRPFERRWNYLIGRKHAPRTQLVIEAFNHGYHILRKSGARDEILVRHLGVGALNWVRLTDQMIYPDE